MPFKGKVEVIMRLEKTEHGRRVVLLNYKLDTFHRLLPDYFLATCGCIFEAKTTKPVLQKRAPNIETETPTNFLWD